ncbi:GGDEF domain-containing protein [Fibrobacter sp. UBA4309]|uniref:GGDEF domain-containing protein n=1 Tax=Fibrobacter sp. UBA4309 TaxID=1946537 RepID=UPI0025BBCE3D|nr:GGDEF domain-containing protein [Fibrobacter sp. UBA4309]
MLGFARRIWAKQETLEQRLFWMILAISLFLAFGCVVITAAEQVGVFAVVMCAMIFVACVVSGILVHVTSRISLGFFILIVFLSCVSSPLLFFLCGGIKSAMPYFLLSGPFLCGFITNRRAKVAGVIFTLFMGVLVFVVAWVKPEWVVEPASDSIVILDIMLNYVLFGAALFGICSYAVNAYMAEKSQKDKLMKKLEELSRQDDLTGLYNRRYFIQYLEDVVWYNRESFYIVMFDIDGFNQINETYGKVFGDSVICAVGRLVRTSLNEDVGERAIRFSGETFACVLRGDSEISAYTRADQIREKVSNLQWQEYPMLHVTVSGGFISCGVGNSFDRRAISRVVDNLLYTVRLKGVNQLKILTSRDVY